MQYLATTTVLSSALAPAIIFSIAGIKLVGAMFLKKWGHSKRIIAEKPQKNPFDEVINKHFQSFVSKEVYLPAKGMPIKTTIIREGISFYTLFMNDQPVMSISKKAFGWVVLKDYTNSSEYKILTLPFIMYVEQVLYN
jgi:hypothetical protein